MGKLIVKIQACRNLKGTDLMSPADCYVKLTVGSKTFKTKTINNDDNPNYNESFSFFLSDAAIDDAVKFELYDAGTFSDDLLGSIYIPIKSLLPSQENSLTLPWEKGSGSLVCVIHPELSDAVSAQMTGTVANNHGSTAPTGGSLYPQIDGTYSAQVQKQAQQVQQQQPQQQQFMPTGGPFGSNSSSLNNSATIGSPYGGNPQLQQQQGGYPQVGGGVNSTYSNLGQTTINFQQVGSSFAAGGQQHMQLQQQQFSTMSTSNGVGGSPLYPGYPGAGPSSYPGAGNTTTGSAYPGYQGYPK